MRSIEKENKLKNRNRIKLKKAFQANKRANKVGAIYGIELPDKSLHIEDHMIECEDGLWVVFWPQLCHDAFVQKYDELSTRYGRELDYAMRGSFGSEEMRDGFAIPFQMWAAQHP
ncbi:MULTISPECIES: hypothetical protein [unclassified Sphingopyxis]|uniref:hypothetical protein n=1 Tax=unclassified Sphingopyxis TaxID=2614943 RepID=UPI0012E397B2|nr:MULTISPECIES: hypothetical protein [unclassified Sphingopyxis]